jgi:hypothetical protein
MPRPSLCLSLLVLALAAGPASGEARTAAEIQSCVDANFPAETSVQTIVLRSKDRIGAETVSKATLYWRKFDDGFSKVMLRFFAPADMRNAGILLIEKPDGRNDTMMYLPELGKVRRVTSRMMTGSMFGTDFSYEEFERVQRFVEDADSQRLPDAEFQGIPVYVLAHRPDPGDESAYESVVESIDRERCVVLKTEFFEEGGRLRKVMSADVEQITREGKIWVPRYLLMRDLRDQTETEFVIEKVELDKPIPKKTFSQRELEAGGS